MRNQRKVPENDAPKKSVLGVEDWLKAGLEGPLAGVGIGWLPETGDCLGGTVHY